MSRQRKGKSYDLVALERAVRAVQSKTMGYQKASKIYNVPRTTIYDKVHGKSEVESRQGPNTVLSPAEETRLANWLIEMSKIGYGRSKQELLETVKLIIKEDGRKNPFKEGRPGKDWYYAFMKRHPEISLRSPRQLGKERAVIKPENLTAWFNEFENFIKTSTGDPLLLQDPSRIYNADESGFSLCPKTGHVLGLRGAKSLYNLSVSDKSQITVLAGMSATAHFLRPLIVYPGQRFSKNMLEGFEEAVMGRSDNGWMDSELFVQWLKTVFVPDIDSRQVKRPVILLVDGHRTHMTLEASDICKQNGIILYCLLQHASHLMQPCDLRLFGALKETWKKALREWQIQHVGQYVTKYEFASIFKHAWVNATKVENAVNGFKDAGLYPLDKNAVLKTDKFQTSELFSRTLSSKAESGQNSNPDKTLNPEEKENTQEESHEPRIIDTNRDETEPAQKDNQEPRDEIMQVQTKEPMEIDTNNQQAEKSTVESPFSKVLKLPEPKKPKSRTVKREILPKAITGEEFRAILIEKKRKREEEEKAKEQRKRDRIQKREEKEKLKQQKAEERIKKTKEREAKKNEKLRMKEVQRKLKLIEKKKATKESDDESGSDFSVHDESDDEIETNSDTCYKCGNSEDGSGWIGCQRCFKFFHRKCTDIDFDELTEDEIEGFPFECLYC